MLDAMVEAFVLIDVVGCVVEWNLAAERTFGWSRAEALGSDMAALLVPADLRDAHRATISRFRASGGEHLSGQRVQLRAQHREGHELPVELTLSMIDIDGELGVACFLDDISERVSAEADLRRLAAIVEGSGDAMISGTLEGTITSWNAAAERIYGYCADEMLGTPAAWLWPEGTLDGVSGVIDALREGPAVPLETQARRKDGELIDVAVTMSALRDEFGELIGVGSVVRDVTELHRADAELAEARSSFEGAFQAAAIGMALVALDGSFMSVNAALCRLLGRDADSLLSITFQELTHPDDLNADLEFVRRLIEGEIDTYELSKRYLRPDGGLVWGLLTVSVVRDANERPLHFVSQVQDITDRKTAESELRRYARQLSLIAEQDPATGLRNRRSFESALGEHVQVARRLGRVVSVIVLQASTDGEALAAAVRVVRDQSRDYDVIAHLGGGRLAVLLPEVGAREARIVRARHRSAVCAEGLEVTCGYATLRRHETPSALLARAVQAAAASEPAASKSTLSSVPPRVARTLEFVHHQLGMPLSILARHTRDRQMFTAVAGDAQKFGVKEGDSIGLEESLCRRMLDGRIGNAVPDLARNSHTREMMITQQLGLRAYAGVPVKLPSGDLYGTLCTFDTQPHPGLGEHEVELLRFAAEIIGDTVAEGRREHAVEHASAAAKGVQTLSGALEARDFYTGEHSRKVVSLAAAVARRLRLTKAQLRDIEHVAQLHDVGKVGVPDAILQKQGPLDPDEWELMRQHPIVGERIIENTPGLEHLAPAIRAEHERWDGTGSPDRLAGNAIPVASRVTLACDAYHAMTSDRPYRAALPHDRALGELRRGAGTQFDPTIVQALLAELADKPVQTGEQPGQLIGTSTDSGARLTVGVRDADG